MEGPRTIKEALSLQEEATIEAGPFVNADARDQLHDLLVLSCVREGLSWDRATEGVFPLAEDIRAQVADLLGKINLRNLLEEPKKKKKKGKKKEKK